MIQLLEIDTVDGFQGNEKDIIILSCVRSGKESSIGFVKDVRRMNVALTRAKSTLWIVGDSRALMTNKDWEHLIRDARRRGKLVKVGRLSYLELLQNKLLNVKGDDHMHVDTTKDVNRELVKNMRGRSESGDRFGGGGGKSINLMGSEEVRTLGKKMKRRSNSGDSLGEEVEGMSKKARREDGGKKKKAYGCYNFQNEGCVKGDQCEYKHSMDAPLSDNFGADRRFSSPSMNPTLTSIKDEEKPHRPPDTFVYERQRLKEVLIEMNLSPHHISWEDLQAQNPQLSTDISRLVEAQYDSRGGGKVEEGIDALPLLSRFSMDSL